MKIKEGTIIKCETKTELKELLSWLEKTHPQLRWVTGNKNTPEYHWDKYFKPEELPEKCGYILAIGQGTRIGKSGAMFFRNELINGKCYIEEIVENFAFINPTIIYAQEIMRNITPPSKSDLMEFLIGG